MKVIDPELLRERSRVLEAHLDRITDALPADGEEFKPGTDAADVAALHLLLGIQVVLDLAVFACIHFGLSAPAGYEEAMARLAHAGRLSDALAERLEKAANFRDAFVHAFDRLEPASLLHAARALPADLRMFMVDIAYHVGD